MLKDLHLAHLVEDSEVQQPRSENLGRIPNSTADPGNEEGHSGFLKVGPCRKNEAANHKLPSCLPPFLDPPLSLSIVRNFVLLKNRALVPGV